MHLTDLSGTFRLYNMFKTKPLRTTSLEETKAPSAMCPLFGGFTVYSLL